MTFPADLFPNTTHVSLENHLSIGGVDLVDLAARFGTPLYIYDAATILARNFGRSVVGSPTETPATVISPF